MSHDHETIPRLETSGTAVISDVCDTLGLRPRPLDNRLWPTRSAPVSFAGPAYTVAGTAEDGPLVGDREKLRAIDEMPAGAIAVWAGNDIRGVCCFGDILASAMKCRGVSGVIVDGGVRDFAFLRDLDLQMMVRYRTPVQAISRWKVTSVGQPIRVRGALDDWITVNPGDVVVADDDGVIVLPREQAPEIAQKTVEWESKDNRARQDILGGMKLLDALEKYGAL
jgi:4-hydroxy-4-methyl-2-oxoglutarate aldolase